MGFYLQIYPIWDKLKKKRYTFLLKNFEGSAGPHPCGDESGNISRWAGFEPGIVCVHPPLGDYAMSQSDLSLCNKETKSSPPQLLLLLHLLLQEPATLLGACLPLGSNLLGVWRISRPFHWVGLRSLSSGVMWAGWHVWLQCLQCPPPSPPSPLPNNSPCQIISQQAGGGSCLLLYEDLFSCPINSF